MKTTTPPAPDEKIVAAWHWHFRTLHALRQRLARERDEQLHAAAAHSQSHAADPGAAAADEAAREVLFAELSAEGNALAETEAALERLRRGTYGICEATGRAIPAERLRAVPWTRFTRDAAARHEQAAR